MCDTSRGTRAWSKIQTSCWWVINLLTLRGSSRVFRPNHTSKKTFPLRKWIKKTNKPTRQIAQLNFISLINHQVERENCFLASRKSKLNHAFRVSNSNARIHKLHHIRERWMSDGNLSPDAAYSPNTNSVCSKLPVIYSLRTIIHAEMKSKKMNNILINL